MKVQSNFIGFVIIVFNIICACSKDKDTDGFLIDNYSIKSIISNGKTSDKFIYNNLGKIDEAQSFYFYNKYHYNKSGQLIKLETATDPQMFDNTYHERNELMTSQNSTFSGYQIFEYNTNSKLKTIKNYFKQNGTWKYTSMIGLEYSGDDIITWNLYDAANVLTQFRLYEYDNNGNVLKEKYYSYLSNKNNDPQLISAVSYKYDDKENPFKVFKEMGQPGFYSNTNNIIESSSILYEEVPGIDKYSTHETRYEYNGNNFPVKVVDENIEYKYEY